MSRPLALAALAFALPLAAHAQAPTAPQCPFDPAYLTAQLGQPFAAGAPENGLIGKGCKYKGKSVDVWIDAGPLQAPTAEAWRKMASPRGTTWKAVPGDPDKAVHETAKPDVSPYPSLSYERKGWIVQINITGVSNKAEIDAWNAKLVKLKRIP